MKEVKIIFIAMEIAMIIGIIIGLFLTNWSKAVIEGTDLIYKWVIFLMSLAAVFFQKEQQAISWE